MSHRGKTEIIDGNKPVQGNDCGVGCHTGESQDGNHRRKQTSTRQYSVVRISIGQKSFKIITMKFQKIEKFD